MRLARTRITVAVMGLGLIACGPSVATNDAAMDVHVGIDVPVDAAIDAVARDVSLADLPDVPAAAMHTYTMSIGPVHLEIGDEQTNCLVVPAANVTPQYIMSISAHLGAGTHHLVFYRANETTPQPTLFRCSAFSGVFNATNFDSPLLIAQQVDTTLTMPADVGMRMAAAQMVRIELHAINTTGGPIDVSGMVTLQTVDQTVPLIPADILFWGNTNIALPAHTTGQVDFFNTPFAGAQIFGLTTHTHELGTLATISIATDPSNDPSMSLDQTLVKETTNWAEPGMAIFDPPLTFTAGQGLHLACHYNNTTDMEVDWGESFYAEMCFMWAYYYPAPVGLQICFDGEVEGYGNPDGGLFCYPP